jgi:hypothetical protein
MRRDMDMLILKLVAGALLAGAGVLVVKVVCSADRASLEQLERDRYLAAATRRLAHLAHVARGLPDDSTCTVCRAVARFA